MYSYDVFASSRVFWIGVLASMLLAIVARILCGNAAILRFQRFSSTAMIIIDCVSILLFPRLHEFFIIGRGDILSQIGATQDIISYGSIAVTDFYPLLHVLGSTQTLLSGAEVSSFISVFPGMQWLAFLASFYCLSRVYARNRTGSYAFLLVAAVFPLGPMHSSSLPMGVALSLVPLLLFVSIRLGDGRAGPGFMVSGLVLASVLPLYHPLAALVIIPPMLFLWSRQKSRFAEDSSTASVLHSSSGQKWLTTFLSVVTIWWVASFTFWRSSASQLIEWMLGEGSTAPSGQQFLSLVDMASLNSYDIIRIAFFTLSPIIVFVVLIALDLVVARRLRIGTHFPFRRFLFSGLVISAIIEMAVFVAPTALDIFRMIWVVQIFLALIAAAILMTSIGNDDSRFQENGRLPLHRKRWSQASPYSTIIIALIVIGVVCAPFCMYKSPMTFRPSEVVIDSEIAGTVFVAQQGVYTSKEIAGFGSYQRLFHAALGMSGAADEVAFSAQDALPDHFGYDQYLYANMSVESDILILVTTYDVDSYSVVWEEADVFNTRDFLVFQEDDESVNRIVDFGNLDCYVVSG